MMSIIDWLTLAPVPCIRVSHALRRQSSYFTADKHPPSTSCPTTSFLGTISSRGEGPSSGPLTKKTLSFQSLKSVLFSILFHHFSPFRRSFPPTHPISVIVSYPQVVSHLLTSFRHLPHPPNCPFPLSCPLK